MVFRVFLVTFRRQRSTLGISPLPGRGRHGREPRQLYRLAHQCPCLRGTLDSCSTPPPRSRLPVPPAPRHRLLLHAPPQSLAAPLSLRLEGRSDRPPPRPQPLRRLRPTRPFLQGGHPGRPPPPGGTGPRQALAPIRRPHRPVPSGAAP